MAAVGAGDSLQVKPVDLSRGGSPAVRRDTAARRRHEYTLGGAPVARAASCTLRGFKFIVRMEHQANKEPNRRSTWKCAGCFSRAEEERRIQPCILEPTEHRNHFIKHRTGFGSGEPSSAMRQSPRLHCRGETT